MKEIKIEFAEDWEIVNTYDNTLKSIDIGGVGGTLSLPSDLILDLIGGLTVAYNTIKENEVEK